MDDREADGSGSGNETDSAPSCLYCGNELAARLEYRTELVEDLQGYHYEEQPTGKVLGYGYSNSGYFCTLRCGYEFGAEMAARGERRQ